MGAYAHCYGTGNVRYCSAGTGDGSIWAGTCTKNKDGKTWSCKQTGGSGHEYIKLPPELWKAVLAAAQRAKMRKRSNKLPPELRKAIFAAAKRAKVRKRSKTR